MSDYWKKVMKGLAIATGGAVLTYVSTVMIPALQESPNAVLLVVLPIVSALVNAGQKLLLDSK